MDKKSKLFLIIFSFFYFLTRLPNLTIIPVFVDEAIYTRWSQIILSDPKELFIPLSDGKQPLFMWVGSVFLRFFSDPLLATRMVSVLAGFITMIALWVLVKELLGKRIANITTLLYILCPFIFFYNRLAVPDGLLTTFYVLTALFSLFLIRKPSLTNSVLLGAILGGGLLTKSTAGLSVFSIPSVLFFANLKKEDRINRITQMGLSFLVALALAVLIYLTLKLSPLYYLIGQRTPDFIFTPKEILAHPIDPFVFRFKDVSGWLWGYLTAPIFLLSLVGLPIMLIKEKRIGLFLATWFFIPLLIEMEIAKGFTPRYFIFVSPVFLIFAAFLINKFVTRRNFYKTAISLVILLPALIFEMKLITKPESAPIPEKEKDGYLEEWSAGYGIYEISSYLRVEAKKGAPITVGTEGTQGYGTLPDGLEIYLRGTPNISVFWIGQNTIINSVPSNLITDAKIHPAYFIVNSSRFFDQQNEHLKLIAKYPKANGQNPLLFYQVIN